MCGVWREGGGNGERGRRGAGVDRVAVCLFFISFVLACFTFDVLSPLVPFFSVLG